MRSRARPAFTVEIRRNRAPAGPKTSPEASSPASWLGQHAEPSPGPDLLKPDLARLAGLFAAGEGRAPGPARPEAPRGRILPNLLNDRPDAKAVDAPEADAPRDEPKPARRSPVRRAADVAIPAVSRRRDAPDLEPTTVPATPVRAAAGLDPVEAAAPERPAPITVPVRLVRARDEAGLKPGERWKRRLPRVLR